MPCAGYYVSRINISKPAIWLRARLSRWGKGSEAIKIAMLEKALVHQRNDVVAHFNQFVENCDNIFHDFNRSRETAGRWPRRSASVSQLNYQILVGFRLKLPTYEAQTILNYLRRQSKLNR